MTETDFACAFTDMLNAHTTTPHPHTGFKLPSTTWTPGTMEGEQTSLTQSPAPQPTPQQSTLPLHALYEQVLGDRNLLGEVLAFLPSVKDCQGALLVNHLWSTTLGVANPWQHLLLAQYPSMQSFLLPSSPTLMTEKKLLSTRLICAKPSNNKKRELLRLREFFRRKFLTFVLRHPQHGRVASCQIPLNRGKDYKQFLEHGHALTIHNVLSVDEYARCDVVLHMHANDSDFISCSDYEVDDMEDLEREGDNERKKKTVHWSLSANAFDFLDAKFMGFLHDNVETPHMPSFALSFTCEYGSDTKEDQMLATAPEGLEGKISLYMDEYTLSSEFEALKLMASWSAAATHMLPDDVVKPMLQHRFRDVYMLTEVDDYDGGMQAFALVPFCDEVSLMSLFQEHTTRLQFVTTESQFPDEDKRNIHISILDFGRDRVVKLSKELCGYEFESFCSLEFLRQAASFTATILPVENEGQHEEDGNAVETVNKEFTVKLVVETYDYEAAERDEQRFFSILDLWKFLSICMTATEG